MLRALVTMVLWGTWTKFSFAVLNIMVYSRACDDKNAEVCSSPWETVWGQGLCVCVNALNLRAFLRRSPHCFLDNVSLVPGAR